MGPQICQSGGRSSKVAIGSRRLGGQLPRGPGGGACLQLSGGQEKRCHQEPADRCSAARSVSGGQPARRRPGRRSPSNVSRMPYRQSQVLCRWFQSVYKQQAKGRWSASTCHHVVMAALKVRRGILSTRDTPTRLGSIRRSWLVRLHGAPPRRSLNLHRRLHDDFSMREGDGYPRLLERIP